MLIEARGLEVRRRGRIILDVPQFGVGGGGVVGILGPNGAGKTTLVRVLAGELGPEAGTVHYDGTAVQAIGAAALARRRAVLPQATTLGFPMTAEQVVRLGRIPHAGRATREADDAAVQAAMAQAGVAGFAWRFVHTLSGGEAQRVQLARVLAQLHGVPVKESALFLDEPTSNLDLAHAYAILDVAFHRAREGGVVVAVLHDLSLAARFCDRVVIMERGRVVADGPPAEVLEEGLLSRVWAVPLRRVAIEDGRQLAFFPG
ncbi:MAG: heme ABC transporter ATP-binding protein [Elioraea sp.]|nr:heme ABC transporter ATP-binding protein [Elioraea sp.]MDW8445648.1 heme ABC transporter ATP-binding protein [Acetobacteraceae bacterium]